MNVVTSTFEANPKLSRGRRRSKGSHRAILAAAEAIVAEKGYAATTIESVAAKAGVGKMTIYRWWPTKADLFTEVYDFLVAPEKLLTDRGALDEDLHYIFNALFGIYRKAVAPAILAGLISDAQHNDDARRNLEGGIVIGRRNLLVAPLTRAQERGEIGKQVDIDFLTDLIVGAIWHKILTRPTGFNSKFLDAICNMVMKQGCSS
jgi:AcrR family transcriptional regulator